MTRWWSRLRPDNFTLALLCTVLLASFLPMHGAAAMVLDDVTDVAIAALFFLHGARPPRESIVAGLLLGFAGILAGPALIGFAANHFGLIAAFIGVATALLLVAMSTRWLRV